MPGIPNPLLNVTLMSVGMLFETEPVAFYELVQLCRDPEHKLFGNTGDKLKSLSLIQDNGQSHNSVREIVLKYTDGDGLDMVWRG
jgi:hypothetical protein